MESKVKKIVSELLQGEISWIHDQLDGTSFVEEGLEAVEKTKETATQQLLLLVNEIRDGQGDTPLQTPRAKNIKVNDDGTISPIDPSKPSSFSSDFSERGVIRAILLNMEWCHTVKTDSLEKTVQAVERLVNEARIDEATKACYEWEKSPNLPATYLIDRIAQLRLLSEEKRMGEK